MRHRQAGEAPGRPKSDIFNTESNIFTIKFIILRKVPRLHRQDFLTELRVKTVENQSETVGNSRKSVENCTSIASGNFFSMKRSVAKRFSGSAHAG